MFWKWIPDHWGSKRKWTPSTCDLVQPDIDLVKRDIDLVKRDIDLVKPDIDLVKPDIDLVQPDIDLVQPDIDLVQPDIDLVQYHLILELVGTGNNESNKNRLHSNGESVFWSWKHIETDHASTSVHSHIIQLNHKNIKDINKMKIFKARSTLFDIRSVTRTGLSWNSVEAKTEISQWSDDPTIRALNHRPVNKVFQCSHTI